MAYSPWVKGTVENCMKQVQAAYRCLQSKIKLGPQNWPSIVEMIQTALNEALLRRLGSREDGNLRTLLEVMTGIKPVRTMLHTSQMGKEQHVERRIEKVRAFQLMNIEKFQAAMEQMHRNVKERVNSDRAKQIKQHNKRTNLVEPRFEVGEFALARRAQYKGHKQAFNWLGPRRITKVISELEYEVENIMTKKTENVHAARLHMYRCNADGKKVSKHLLQHMEHSKAKSELVDNIKDIPGNRKDGLFLKVEWLGLPDKRDWTWQPLKELYEDVPARVVEFLKRTKKNKATKTAMSEIVLSD